MNAVCLLASGCLILGLGALPAQSAWKTLNGQAAPGLDVEQWLNVDGDAPTLAELKGKVWLLYFFAST